VGALTIAIRCRKSSESRAAYRRFATANRDSTGDARDLSSLPRWTTGWRSHRHPSDEHFVEMRKNSPFLSVLNQGERRAAIARANGAGALMLP